MESLEYTVNFRTREPVVCLRSVFSCLSCLSCVWIHVGVLTWWWRLLNRCSRVTNPPICHWILLFNPYSSPQKNENKPHTRRQWWRGAIEIKQLKYGQILSYYNINFDLIPHWSWQDVMLRIWCNLFISTYANQIRSPVIYLFILKFDKQNMQEH